MLVTVQVLPDPVEDYDRIVQRIAYHRKHRSHNSEADLQPEDADERDGGENVVCGCGYRGQAEAPLEPIGEIRQHGKEGKEDGEKCFLAELAPDLRTNGLRPEHGVVPLP